MILQGAWLIDELLPPNLRRYRSGQWARSIGSHVAMPASSHRRPSNTRMLTKLPKPTVSGVTGTRRGPEDDRDQVPMSGLDTARHVCPGDCVVHSSSPERATVGA